MFPLGEMVMTTQALHALDTANTSAITLLRRHQCGDWGEIGVEDRAENEEALKIGNRLMSVYTLRTGVTVWVITEWDRSVTTVLLPEDY